MDIRTVLRKIHGGLVFRRRYLDGALRIALVAACLACLPATADTYTVTSLDNSGAGSLRQAITDADAATGADTIVFDADLNGTIVLASSLPTITDSDGLTIDGDGRITLSGNDTVQLFRVEAPLELHSLTVANGLSGGGAIYSDTDLVIRNSSFRDNFSWSEGGAIVSTGDLTISGSTFSGNVADFRGGAVFQLGSILTVSNSTFSDNTSTGHPGGAIFLDSHSGSTITNSTFTGNSASSVGGALAASGSLTLTNTIMAGNTAGLTEGNCHTFGTVTDGGNNILGTADCGITDGVNGNIIGDPLLDALSDNGGPTATHALLADSPAIDAGNNTVCAASPVNGLDQRGLARPLYASCAIGAYEVTWHTLTYNAGANGSLTGDTPQEVLDGHDGSAVTAVPDTGYHFNQWNDGNTDNPRTDTGVTAGQTVTAEFSINQYTLTYAAGSDGSLTGSASQTVDHGDDGRAVTAVPDTNYHFTQWSDGNTDNPRTDTGVTAGLNVTAEFAINQYNLTYTAGSNGSLTGSASQSVDHGDDGSAVTAEPDTGYHFTQWSDGITDNPRTDTGVTAGLNVTAEFAINQYTLTYTAGANGSLTGSASQTVDHGDDGSAVTAEPATGYHFTQWDDGNTDNPRTDTGVTAGQTVTAEFAINQYTLTYTAGSNGSLTGSASQTVDHGNDGSTITAVPDTGYYFIQWSDGSTYNPRTDTGLTTALTVTAEFEAPVNITGLFVNDGVIGNATISKNGILQGGSVSGNITSEGEVRDVLLQAGASIVGGHVSGTITGSGSDPAYVEATIGAGTVLHNLRISANASLDPAAILESGVCFHGLDIIPPGFELSGLLASVPWAGNAEVKALKLDQSLGCYASTPTLLEALQELEVFESATLTQMPDTAVLEVLHPDGRALVLPIQVSQADIDDEVGAFFNTDGDVVLVTSRGQRITAFAVQQAEATLRLALADQQWNVNFDRRGGLRISSDEMSVVYRARPHILARRVSADQPPGLSQFPLAALPSVFVAGLVFEDDSSQLLQQLLPPLPDDWPLLEQTLLALPGVETVRLDADGVISLTVDGQVLRAMADYAVRSGPPPQDETDGVLLEETADLNGDGIVDFRLVFPDGKRQNLYLLP